MGLVMFFLIKPEHQFSFLSPSEATLPPVLIGAALAVVAHGAQRLQVARSQPQMPVPTQRLDVIDIHAGAVLGRPAAGEAGGRLRQLRIAQPLPLGGLIEAPDFIRGGATPAGDAPQQQRERQQQ